ncbi:hypothetical protein B7494_g8520 [Chlorociboria aeruginascens]|nr:hypothetical protein B7494_g8520 [Chlorociboria aeruginascens]
MAFDSNTYYAITSNKYSTESLIGTSGGVFISPTDPTDTNQQWQLFPFNSTVYIMRTVDSMTSNAYLTAINSGPALPQMQPADKGDNSIFWTLTEGSGGYVLSSGKLGSAFHLEAVDTATLNVVDGTVGEADEWSLTSIGGINDVTFSSVTLGSKVLLAQGAAATTNLIAAASAGAAQAGRGSSVSASPAAINTPIPTPVQASPEQVSPQATSTPNPTPNPTPNSTPTPTPTPQTVDSQSTTPISTSDAVTSPSTSVIISNTFIAESALSASSPDTETQFSDIDTNTVFTIASSNSNLGASSTVSSFITTTNTLSPTSTYTSTTTLVPISSSAGLSSGAKAGIAISVLCLVLIILTFIFFLLRQRRHKLAAKPQPDNLELAEKPHLDPTPTETPIESVFAGTGDIKRSETLTRHPAHRNRACSCPEHGNPDADNAPEIARALSLSTGRALNSDNQVQSVAELESPLSPEDMRLLGLNNLGGRFGGLNRERLSQVHEMEDNVPIELSAERNSGVPYWAKPPPEEMMAEGEGEWEHSMSDGGSVWGLEEYTRNSMYKDKEPSSAAALQGSRLRQEVSREETKGYDGEGYGAGGEGEDDGLSLYDSEDYSEDEEKDIHEKEKVKAWES